MFKGNKSVTLIELLIAVALIFMVVSGLASMEIFSRQHLIASNRRAQLQNELSSILDEMSKYAVQASGDYVKNKPAFEILSANDGFRIRMDKNTTPTADNPDDDLWYTYTLSGNKLTFSCTNVDGTASTACPTSVVLSSHIISGVAVNQTMSTVSPAYGFYINLADNSTAAEVGLVARYDPASSIALQNPQIQMKARLQTSNVSAN